MEIEPSLPFTIWRKLEDPSDSSTYYIQATLYNMRDNTVIQTVNLTDQGSRIFSKEISAPGDSSGQGRWISISTRVYTDSGFTSLSPIHKEESREYKVIRRIISLGGGGGSEVDYKKIGAILTEVVGKIPQPKEISLVPLEQAIQDVGDKVDSIHIPTTDLSPVLGAIRGLKNDLENTIKSIPKPDKVDFSPVMQKLALLDNLDKAISAINVIGQASSGLSKLSNDIRQFLIDHIDQMDTKFAKAFKEFSDKAEAISNLTFNVKPALPTPAETKPIQPPNLNRAGKLL